MSHAKFEILSLYSLQCESLSQIWLLLKSSDFITQDLTLPFKDCSDNIDDTSFQINYVLALKRWSNSINPATEFRCFIKNKKLFAIGEFYDESVLVRITSPKVK